MTTLRYSNSFPRKDLRSEKERFMDMVSPEPNTGCWLWLGAQVGGRKRYGQFSRDGRRNTLAHRAAFIVFRGVIPVGLCVLHRCDTPECVNPDHLFLGTRQDNNADMARKGRGRARNGLPFGVVANADGGFVAQVKHRGLKLQVGWFRTAGEAAIAVAEKKAALRGAEGQ